jgi:CBS domain-containing protein
MKVEQAMAKDVKTCRPHDSLQAAAQIMWDSDCGCVPVVNEDRRLVSIITDRDISMAACLQNRPLREIPISQVMSKSLWTVSPGDPVQEALRTMQEKKVRRLPVVDGQDRLVGLLSLNDLARQAARERRKKEPEVTDAEVGETLAALCEPHAPARPARAPARAALVTPAPAASPA